MKQINFLILVLIAASFLTLGSCTKYYINEPENPDEKPDTPEEVKKPIELFFNTTWKQTQIYVCGMNSYYEYNEDAILEFTDIRYKDTDKYYVRVKSGGIGIYSIGNGHIYLEWRKVDPENGWKSARIYGDGFYKLDIDNSSMKYYNGTGMGSTTYYYSKISD